MTIADDDPFWDQMERGIKIVYREPYEQQLQLQFLRLIRELSKDVETLKRQASHHYD